jgi:hypothetical protein
MLLKNKFEEYILDNKEKYNLENNELFLSIVIGFIVFIFIANTNVNLSVILGILIAYYVFRQFIFAAKNHEDKRDKIFDNKVNLIRPSAKSLKKYPDVIEFLFSIQDFYLSNPATYEEIVETIKSFFIVYEESMRINKLSHLNYSVAEGKMNNAVNCVHALIITSDSHPNLNEKINIAYNKLYEILNKYLNEIELNIKKDIKYNGYNINTKVIDYKMKPYNYDESELYNFNIVY